METVPEHIQALITVKGFYHDYFTKLNDPMITTQRQAYEYIETEYQKYFGRRRYANFESFINFNNSRLRKKR